jgi:hypothetical protein
MNSERFSRRWLWAAGLVSALVSGAALRLLFVDDIEYKRDELWTYHNAQEVAKGTAIPWTGMATSMRFRNPGMSLWIFAAITKVCAINDPRELARAVQILSILAIGILVFFAWRIVPEAEREPWLWATALVSLNPLAVLFHRKIWPPSVLPLFTIVFLIAWWHRDRRAWAFIWGLIGSCLGQIHMSGFFFAAGFVGWTFLFRRQGFAWKSWLGGASLGMLPLVPWIDTALPELYAARESGPGVIHLLEAKFWLRWATEPFGISVHYALENDFADYLGYPVVGGHKTYLVGVLHALLVVCVMIFAARAARLLWRYRYDAWQLLVGTSSETAFAQSAALWGFGVLLTASMVSITRHYLVVLFPLTFLWLARLALSRCRNAASDLRLGRLMLSCLCLLQALISATFLGYIHVNQRPIRGDYGTPYAAQQHKAEPLKEYAGVLQVLW